MTSIRKFIQKGDEYDPNFRWRGGEVSRLEGLSDAVFAFGITLLVVSLEVPKTYDEMLQNMQGFVAFAFSFALLTYIWHSHYIFFRRYGMQDTLTITLNSVLLFVFLFYIYPLKFLSNFLMKMFFFSDQLKLDADGRIAGIIFPNDISSLMFTYSVGYLLLFLVFVVFYVRALRNRTKLDLNEVEVLETRAALISHLIMVVTAAASLAILYSGIRGAQSFSGIIYMVLPVAFTVHGFYFGKKIQKALDSQPAAEATPV